MRSTYLLLMGLCLASLSCTDIACPDELVQEGLACRCPDGGVPTGGQELPCVPGPLAIDGGGLDASLPVAATRPCVREAECVDAGSMPDAASADASR